MKRCPTCDKTFDDAMRFCQTDGTPLVEDAPVDPYKTMVANQDDIAAALKDMNAAKEPSAPVESEDVLQIPEDDDPRKTMVASKDEIDQVLAEEPAMEIPPAAKVPEPPQKAAEPAPEPPPFIAPPEEKPKVAAPPPVSANPFDAPKAAEPAKPVETPKAPEPPKASKTPPSPFDSEPMPDFSMTTPPIPSPFNEPKAPDFIDPKPPKESKPAEAAPPVGASSGSSNPFDPPPANNAPAEWKPPAPPEAAWQGQALGKDTPLQPPAVESEGKNRTLALVSLIVSICSIPCCGFIIVGIVGAVLGFIAKGKIKSDPATYGGGGMATAAIVIGIITFLIGLVGNTLMFLGFLPMPQF